MASFEERILAVVRSKGPDVSAGTVFEHLDDVREPWFGPTFARVQLVLEQLAVEGVLVRRDVEDSRGRPRHGYSIGVGRRSSPAASLRV